MTRNTVIHLHRSTELPEQWFAEHLQLGRWPVSGPGRHIVIGDASDEARALVLRNQSLRLFSLRASVTIAALCVVYFAWQFLGRPGL